ncbi:MAG: hypothetical protein PHD30_01860, partial [Paludibacter sp.]|nr:hypothetical protein [Paludibacter sp.]
NTGMFNIEFNDDNSFYTSLGVDKFLWAFDPEKMLFTSVSQGILAKKKPVQLLTISNFVFIFGLSKVYAF